MNLSKKFILAIFTLVFGSLMFVPSFAMASDKGKEENAGTRPGLLRFFEKDGRAAIGSGVVKSKETNSLVVTKDDKDVTVNVTDKTQFRRRFWGKGTFDEIQTGDTVNVIGRWADDAHTAINAVLIRDLSIQKRLGVFFGTVKSMNSNVWVISTLKKGEQEVTVNTTTKLVNRKGETISLDDVKTEHRVRVRGLWDKTKSTITEVSQVKDFDLPVKPTPTATP